MKILKFVKKNCIHPAQIEAYQNWVTIPNERSVVSFVYSTKLMSEDDNETESACNSSVYKQIEMQDFLALYVNEIAMVILELLLAVIQIGQQVLLSGN